VEIRGLKIRLNFGQKNIIFGVFSKKNFFGKNLLIPNLNFTFFGECITNNALPSDRLSITFFSKKIKLICLVFKHLESVCYTFFK